MSPVIRFVTVEFRRLAPRDVHPADIARQFKSYSGKHLLDRYLEIREANFWGGGFWKVGYYVGTMGAVSEEVIER